jgi:hypothetical protein
MLHRIGAAGPHERWSGRGHGIGGSSMDVVDEPQGDTATRAVRGLPTTPPT